LFLLPVGIWGGHQMYEYLTDKISIQVKIKK